MASKISNVDTQNVGGSVIKGGSGCSDPHPMKSTSGDKPMGHSLGFQTSGLHAHLGHFGKDDVLRKGHNAGPLKITGSNASAVIGTRGKTGVAKSIDSLSNKTARKAIKAGGDTGANVAAERPVLAARIAAKSAGASRKEVRAAVKTARSDPNSARSERKARKAGTPVTAGGY